MIDHRKMARDFLEGKTKQEYTLLEHLQEIEKEVEQLPSGWRKEQVKEHIKSAKRKARILTKDN
jgi:hypothetical protein